LATYREAEDLIAVGAYKKGSSERIDRAISVNDLLTAFLRQDVGEIVSDSQAWEDLRSILAVSLRQSAA
jgi:flagellum-specific ATP synthase